MLEQRIQQQFFDSADAKYAAAEALTRPVCDAAQILLNCITSGGKVLACGNGGSAGDAQHFAAELVGRFEAERGELAAIALTTDSSILSADATSVKRPSSHPPKTLRLTPRSDGASPIGRFVNHRTLVVTGWPPT